jgi:hypothetical protein
MRRRGGAKADDAPSCRLSSRNSPSNLPRVDVRSRRLHRRSGAHDIRCIRRSVPRSRSTRTRHRTRRQTEGPYGTVNIICTKRLMQFALKGQIVLQLKHYNYQRPAHKTSVPVAGGWEPHTGVRRGGSTVDSKAGPWAAL